MSEHQPEQVVSPGGSGSALAKLDSIAGEFRALTEALRDAARRQRLRNVIEGTGVVLLAIFLLVALSLFNATSRAVDEIQRQAVTNDLDILDHRIADKERAQCSEQFIRDVVKQLRSGASDVDGVDGCFTPETAKNLEELRARRAEAAGRLTELNGKD